MQENQNQLERQNLIISQVSLGTLKQQLFFERLNLANADDILSTPAEEGKHSFASSGESTYLVLKKDEILGIAVLKDYASYLKKTEKNFM